MKYSFVVFILFLSLCNKPEPGLCPPIPRFTVYSVAAGHHDFLPNDQVRKTYNATVNFEVVLDSSMYWEFNGDPDYYDISKLTGFTDRSNANNKSSAILGWRPLKDHHNQFELFGFVNHSNSSFDFDKIGDYNSNTILSGSIVWANNRATFTITDEELQETSSVELFVYNEGISSYRMIGGWFGGNDKAPKDMCYWLFILSPGLTGAGQLTNQ